MEELKEIWVDPVVGRAKLNKPVDDVDVDIAAESMEDALLEALPVWVSSSEPCENQSRSCQSDYCRMS